MKIATRSDSVSMNATFNGDAMGIQFVNGFSICASWSGTDLDGTIKLQASNNPFTDNVNMTINPSAVWVDITGSSVVVSADTGSQFYNVADANYWAYRIVWTRTDGTGTLVAHHLIKGIQ